MPRKKAVTKPDASSKPDLRQVIADAINAHFDHKKQYTADDILDVSVITFDFKKHKFDHSTLTGHANAE